MEKKQFTVAGNHEYRETDNKQFELSKASYWFQANKLTLNVSKTKYIVFRNKSMPFNDQGYIISK